MHDDVIHSRRAASVDANTHGCHAPSHSDSNNGVTIVLYKFKKHSQQHGYLLKNSTEGRDRRIKNWASLIHCTFHELVLLVAVLDV